VKEVKKEGRLSRQAGRQEGRISRKEGYQGRKEGRNDTKEERKKGYQGRKVVKEAKEVQDGRKEGY
jgi:hypothetical protein